tara:strand:- start:1287 stop:1946 length:660 start_codon:yes stop_codon:yes gene_type:complete
MVLVSHKYKFIYIKNQKVAGSSVESLFGKYCVGPKYNYTYVDDIQGRSSRFGILGTRKDDKRNWKPKRWFDMGHIKAKKIKNKIGSDKFNSYTKFSVIRNPYDKMVSLFFYNKSRKKIPNNMTFKQFVKSGKKCNNFKWHAINNISTCDYFIRYETLEEDIKKMCDVLKIKDIDINNLPNHKSDTKRNNRDYREYYDEITKKIVYEGHKIEFMRFGYKF